MEASCQQDELIARVNVVKLLEFLDEIELQDLPEIWSLESQYDLLDHLTERVRSNLRSKKYIKAYKPVNPERIVGMTNTSGDKTVEGTVESTIRPIKDLHGRTRDEIMIDTLPQMIITQTILQLTKLGLKYAEKDLKVFNEKLGEFFQEKYFRWKGTKPESSSKSTCSENPASIDEETEKCLSKSSNELFKAERLIRIQKTTRAANRKAQIAVNRILKNSFTFKK